MNFYANDSNYLLPSFNPPVTPPDVDPDAGVLIKVAYNPAWKNVLLGAVTQMLQFGAWAGTDDAKNLAVLRAAILMTALQTDLSAVDTPYWDDASDVDDQAPSDIQTWYGEVTNPTDPPGELDFVENAAVWVFTGLIALATPELGFAPAIAFHTIAPKFILAQKRGDFGTVIRIILDGQDQVTVDTSANAPGDIIEIPIVGDSSLEGHDLLVINTLA